jgi:YD repeat-containing protein
MNHRRERPRHLRQGKRLKNGTIVVAEYDAAGQLLRETFYYSTDDRLLTRIVEGGPNERESPNAA